MNFQEVESCDSGAIEVTAEGVNLPVRAADLVKLSNWNTENNADLPVKASSGLDSTASVEEHENEVYYGYNGAYAHQLFVGRESDWLPVADLQSISLRCRRGQKIFIWYSFVKFKR